jgi:hypothetical protein
MSYDETVIELKKLQALTNQEADSTKKYFFYDAIASYGKISTQFLIELAEKEKDSTAKHQCMAALKAANSK